MSTSTTYEKLPLQPLFDTIEELKPKFIERLQRQLQFHQYLLMNL